MRAHAPTRRNPPRWTGPPDYLPRLALARSRTRIASTANPPHIAACCARCIAPPATAANAAKRPIRRAACCITSTSARLGARRCTMCAWCAPPAPTRLDGPAAAKSCRGAPRKPRAPAPRARPRAQQRRSDPSGDDHQHNAPQPKPGGIAPTLRQQHQSARTSRYEGPVPLSYCPSLAPQPRPRAHHCGPPIFGKRTGRPNRGRAASPPHQRKTPHRVGWGVKRPLSAAVRQPDRVARDLRDPQSAELRSERVGHVLLTG